MNCPVVSIIVAAYNAEKYLNRCLDSIRQQTHNDWECLVIDDGSTDESGRIADDYGRRDTRFRIIHQKNGGVATARQLGLDNARGVYTIHVDSDDWIAPNMLEELVNNADDTRADMVICDYFEVYDDHINYNCQKPSPADRLSIFGQSFNILAGSLWNKLIKRTCYTDWGISFENGINLEEDKLVCLKILSHPIKVTYLNKAFYYYNHVGNAGSLSNQWNPALRLKILELINEYCDVHGVQSYYDNAIFYLAYQAISYPRAFCPNFIDLFEKHRNSIKKATGFHWYTKLLVSLRLNDIYVPTPGRLRYGIRQIKVRITK